MRTCEALGSTFVGPVDCELLEPTSNILFPQQTKVAGFIGFANAQTDFYQNCRSGAIAPKVPLNSDIVPFVEMYEYRPPGKKKQIKCYTTGQRTRAYSPTCFWQK
jgi:hypothetical protein